MIHLQRNMDKVKEAVLALGAEVEHMVEDAVEAVARRDLERARRVIDRDPEIDAAEVTLEEDILKILALYQPVAVDLRWLVAILKINSDLERIGDLAVNIAETAVYLCHHEPLPFPFDFPAMSRRVREMLRDTLDALVRLDTERARAVCRADDAVDEIHNTMYKEVARALREDPGNAETYLHLLHISRNLERIADHCTNIAEDTLYTAEGSIVRHGGG